MLCEKSCRGNSLLVVEHDMETIEQADFIIDIGPEAGSRGGKIVACGQTNRTIEEGISAYTASHEILKNLISPKGSETK